MVAAIFIERLLSSLARRLLQLPAIGGWSVEDGRTSEADGFIRPDGLSGTLFPTISGIQMLLLTIFRQF